MPRLSASPIVCCAFRKDLIHAYAETLAILDYYLNDLHVCFKGTISLIVSDKCVVLGGRSAGDASQRPAAADHSHVAD